MASVDKAVTFTEFKEPKLKSGVYGLHAELSAGGPKGPPISFTADARFAVAGLRFRLGGDDLVSVFPPALATGEFGGVLPHVVLARPTLPWQRTSVAGAGNANVPWLAVLTLQQDELAALPAPAVTAKTAADLVPQGTPISVAGQAAGASSGVGAMPPGTVATPGLSLLDYGESAADPVNVVDLAVPLFSRIAPTAADLALLANVRTTDTHDSVDNTDTQLTRAIVLGNRAGRVGGKALALLVSLENLGSYLPDEQGNPSAAFGGATTIRLVVLNSWPFTVTDGGATLEHLLTHLNSSGIATVRMPGAAVDAARVQAATAAQPTGIGDADADALVANALAAGYVPMDHHLREAGKTVSWYRGPLLPYGMAAPAPPPAVSGPDALLRYDPTLGMFDTSYAAAWQLGQLMALQSRSFSLALLQWKHQSARSAAIAGEASAFMARLTEGNATALPSFTNRLRANGLGDPQPAQVIADFIGALRLLRGVPFGYLVPNEQMLPPESLRMFSLDPAWMEALVDGAFSIGRSSQAQAARDAGLARAIRPLSIQAARGRRRNDRPHLAQLKAGASSSQLAVTGLLIRSQAIRNWPQLQIDGYSDTDDSHPPDVAKLSMTNLSQDVLLCLFDGPVRMIAIHQPPEQLHSGVELATDGSASTTLRAVAGDHAGLQYPVQPHGTARIAMRSDALTIRAAAGGEAIRTQLNTWFGQSLARMSANEFALQMVKGVVRVEYLVGETA
ncbi:MAG: hypothetical protein H4O13_04785 [Xanthomonadales bacterium]|nr:hypothetical protein [Xanthomonadales bacterium]